MDTGAWFRIGYVIKKCGLRGSVKIFLEEQIPDSITTLFIDQQRRPIPFFIENIDRINDTAIVKLEEVDTPEKASKLAQKVIYLPKKNYNPQKKDQENVKKSIIGYSIIHNTKTLGIVKHLNDYAPNPLLTVACVDKDILIPLNNYFVRKINDEQKEITVALPDGFLAI